MRKTREWIHLFKGKMARPISFSSTQINSASKGFMHPRLCATEWVFSTLTGTDPRVPGLVIPRGPSARPHPRSPTRIVCVTAPSQRRPQALSVLAIQSSPPPPNVSPVHPLLICRADSVLHSFSTATLIIGHSVVYRNTRMFESRWTGSRVSV